VRCTAAPQKAQRLATGVLRPSATADDELIRPKCAVPMQQIFVGTQSARDENT
jgi:hypothetical protein